MMVEMQTVPQGSRRPLYTLYYMFVVTVLSVLFLCFLLYAFLFLLAVAFTDALWLWMDGR
jgi:hypothetical protein